MKVKELIEQLEKYEEKNPDIYINYEPNWEEEILIKMADTGNLLFIPKSKYDQLKDSQEFFFVE